MGCERYRKEEVRVVMKEAWRWFRSARVGDVRMCLVVARRERAKF
jgi:hypothetical protein